MLTLLLPTLGTAHPTYIGSLSLQDNDIDTISRDMLKVDSNELDRNMRHEIAVNRSILPIW